MKIFIRLMVIVVCIVLLITLFVAGQNRSVKSIGNEQIIEIRPFSLRDEILRQVEKYPKMTAAEVTACANSLLKEKGFDYEFETLYFTRKNQLESVNPDNIHLVFQFHLEQSAGKEITLQSAVEDGLCSEQFAYLPAFRVTQDEMILSVDGTPTRFRRPKEFGLDVMELVDSTLQKAKVMRRWEIPEQTVPAGISADGKTLYVPVNFDRRNTDARINSLCVLAVSSSDLRFEIASVALKRQKAEDIRNFPRDPDNSYLGFRKFRVAGRSYIIRYSNPCS